MIITTPINCLSVTDARLTQKKFEREPQSIGELPEVTELTVSLARGTSDRTLGQRVSWESRLVRSGEECSPSSFEVIHASRLSPSTSEETGEVCCPLQQAVDESVPSQVSPEESSWTASLHQHPDIVKHDAPHTIRMGHVYGNGNVSSQIRSEADFAEEVVIVTTV